MSSDIEGLLPLPELVTPEDGFSLLQESVVNGAIGKRNKLEGKDTFNAIVLTKVSDVPFSPKQIGAVFGMSIKTNESDKYYGYRVKITDEDSPHSFYPSPCDIKTEGKLTAVNSVICGMHTLIISKEALSAEDTCQVRLTKVGGKYDLSYGFFVDKTGHDSEYHTRILMENPYLRDECGATGALFNAKVRSLGIGSAANSIIDGGIYKGFPIFAEPTEISQFGLRHGSKFTPTAVKNIMIHTTVTTNAAAAISTLGGRGLAYHYIIEPNGNQITVIDGAYHASHGGQATPGVNSSTIGISLVNLAYEGQRNAGKTVKVSNGTDGGGTYTIPTLDKWIDSDGKKWQPFPEAQINSLEGLIQIVCNMHKSIEYISGHEDDPLAGKEDPGPAFDRWWPRIYKIKNASGVNLKPREDFDAGYGHRHSHSHSKS
tara:strand:+ start:35 stop:1321 length:1287 start_codon:yes stop_codon:yes gene_type:complete